MTRDDTLDPRVTSCRRLPSASMGLAAPRRGPGVDGRLAYVGTYTTDGRSEGIYRLRLDTETGALRLDGVAAKAANPSYLALHPNGRVLYAVNELSEFGGEPTGAVSAFGIDRASGALTLLNQQPSHGKAPCYVSVDRGGRVVLVANYGGGSITTIPVRRDGGLADGAERGAPCGHRGGPGAPGGAARALHSPGSGQPVRARGGSRRSMPCSRIGWTTQTGAISVVAPGAATKPGAGPRHLTFHPNGRFAYVVNELDSTVSVFAYDGEHGALDEVQVTAASPGGTVPDNHPADIHVAAGGRHLYTSNRGDDTIAVFVIDPRIRPGDAGTADREWRAVAAELRARPDGAVPRGGEPAVGCDRELSGGRGVGAPNADRVVGGAGGAGVCQVPLALVIPSRQARNLALLPGGQDSSLRSDDRVLDVRAAFLTFGRLRADLRNVCEVHRVPAPPLAVLRDDARETVGRVMPVDLHRVLRRA